MYKHIITRYALPDDAKRIREEVFVEEQHFKEEFDTLENMCIHLVLYDFNIPVATARLFMIDSTNARIGRIATILSYRGRGLGRQLIALMEDQARLAGAIISKVNAQILAKVFYEKCGYISTEIYAYEEHVEHVEMCKKL